MKNYLFLIVVFALINVFPISCFSQNTNAEAKYQIETLDGNEYFGIILTQTTDTIQFKADKLGEISIPRSEIKKISPITVSEKNGEYWLDNPQSTRYFWAPNGYSLKKGEGYYQNVWVLFNQAVLGLTNHFSAGVGTLPLFLFSSPYTPVWATVKYSLPVVENKFNLGAGALMGTVVGESNTGFGILYGIATFGSKDKNLNVGLGWGYADGEIASNPTVNISCMIRTGAKGYFISENYFIGTPENFIVMTSLGGRRIIKHVGLDFGAFVPIGGDVDEFVAIPWLGITIPFGNKLPTNK